MVKFTYDAIHFSTRETIDYAALLINSVNAS